jgi:alkylhydroperoxidase family enzyme
VESIGAVLPYLYPIEGIAQKIIDDPGSAPIPEVHKAMFRWVEKFARRSWEMDRDDISELKTLGVGDADIVEWAQVACLQTWWVMSADGGGIPLEGNAVTGVAVRHTRDWYESATAGLLAAASDPAANQSRFDRAAVAWVDTRQTDEGTYGEAMRWANDRYGFVPNLFRAVSLQPDILPRHQLALELLERPQSPALSPLRHAMVRALVAALNRSGYSHRTTREQLLRAGGDDALFGKVTGDFTGHDWDAADRLLLNFAAKAARSTYKITAEDAGAFRVAGLGEEAYVDVLNTVSIETSLDRLANSLGVAPDDRAILPSRGAS